MTGEPLAITEAKPKRLPVRSVRRIRHAPERLSEPVRLDGRTRTARAAHAFRAELVQHVGGTPSAVQSALIEQAVQIKLRLMLMDGAFAERGAQSAHDAKQYLAWANSLSRLLRNLGLEAQAPAEPSILDTLAALRGRTLPSHQGAPGTRPAA